MSPGPKGPGLTCCVISAEDSGSRQAEVVRTDLGDRRAGPLLWRLLIQRGALWISWVALTITAIAAATLTIGWTTFS